MLSGFGDCAVQLIRIFSSVLARGSGGRAGTNTFDTSVLRDVLSPRVSDGSSWCDVAVQVCLVFGEVDGGILEVTLLLRSALVELKK